VHDSTDTAISKPSFGLELHLEICSLFTNIRAPLADMREHFVIDPLIGKRQQLLLATQLCRMVLKVCENYLCYFRLMIAGSSYALVPGLELSRSRSRREVVRHICPDDLFCGWLRMSMLVGS